MFPCRQCQQPAFLYLGVCASCSPESHSAYHAQRDHWYALFARFKSDTGKEPLEDWQGWEAWCEKGGGNV